MHNVRHFTGVEQFGVRVLTPREFLRIEPPSVTLAAGQTFSLDVAVAHVTDLYAFQFALAFDPSIIMAPV